MELLIDFASEEVEDDASEQDHDPRVHIAALALGLIYVGTGEDECAQPMIERLLQCSDAELSKPETRLYMVGLALIYLGCEEGADVARDILSTLSNKAFKDFALITLNACAYAGSGSVLKVRVDDSLSLSLSLTHTHTLQHRYRRCSTHVRNIFKNRTRAFIKHLQFSVLR